MSGRDVALLAVSLLTVLGTGGLAVLRYRAVTRKMTAADMLLAGFALYAAFLAVAGWLWWLFFGGAVT